MVKVNLIWRWIYVSFSSAIIMSFVKTAVYYLLFLTRFLSRSIHHRWLFQTDRNGHSKFSTPGTTVFSLGCLSKGEISTIIASYFEGFWPEHIGSNFESLTMLDYVGPKTRIAIPCMWPFLPFVLSCFCLLAALLSVGGRLYIASYFDFCLRI